MSQRVIPHANGTATVISDSFAPFGEIGGAPSRVERDFEGERKADRITRSALRVQFPCDATTFDALLMSAEFPRAVARITETLEPIFSKQQINRFIAERRALVAQLPDSVQ